MFCVTVLSGAVETAMKDDEHTKIERPLLWYYALDSLNAIRSGGQSSIICRARYQLSY
jgi:hypothetical protein